MKKLLFLLLLSISVYARPKIYDCFLFYNELEILNIRLHEMYEHVDKFVLVESVETFRGNPKPLYYAENKALFAPFADKIIHIVVEEKLDTPSAWDREYFQRNQIMRGLKGCAPEDVIFISDVDEIVRGNKVSYLVNLVSSDYKRLRPFVTYVPVFCFYLNRFERNDYCTVATSHYNLSLHSPQHCRTRKSYFTKVQNTGWHFTSIGKAENFINKIQNYSHTEWDTPENRDPEHFEKVSSSGRFLPINHFFPLYIQQNIPHLQEIGFLKK